MRTEFTVEVYETHARIALEKVRAGRAPPHPTPPKAFSRPPTQPCGPHSAPSRSALQGDHEEFNQCQTQLKSLSSIDSSPWQLQHLMSTEMLHLPRTAVD